MDLIPQFKSADFEDATDNTFRIIASTDDKDRYGDIVEQDWSLSDFRKNPIILFGHDSSKPVGKATSIAVEDAGKRKRLVAQIELAPEGTTPDVDNLRRLIQAKIIRAASVGFYPGAAEDLRDKDGRITGFRFSKNQLFEISLVSVPANPNTLALSRSLDIDSESTSRLLTGADNRPFYSHMRALIQALRASAR